MANHESPEWETATPSTDRNSFWNRLSQPFTSGNPFLRTPRPAAVERKTTYFTRSPTTQTQTFDDKETAVSETVGTGAAGDGVVGHENERRYFGRSKRTCILLSLALAIILILIIGLAAGLASRKSSSQNLPLPTNHGIFTGDLTYYAPGLGACGITSTSQESICAVSHIIWDASSTGSNPNNNPLCGKKIRITRNNGSGNHSVDVKVVDRCVGCKATDLDLSIKMFTSLADESQGRVVGSWAWLT